MINNINRVLQKLKIHLYFIDDVRDIDTIGVLQKIKINTQFSFSYIVLLASSTVVCTLGLLLNSAPVVIGGMLISPLMWPLMKISVGVSYERKSFITQAIHLLTFSIIIGLVSAVLITSLSPLKIVTNEILTRTTPTLLDIFVAMAAGGIAAFSIVQRKISDSLAGVAIATSLMPPLCVSGIGLALGIFQIAFGSFLLFFTNIISIIFISVLIFTFVGIKRQNEVFFRRKGIIFIIIILILTALPLAYLLRNYSFKSTAYQESKNIISKELLNISPALMAENISVETKSSVDNTIFVSADIISPDTINLDYSQKAKIVSLLEKQLGKKINFIMRIQKTISIKSEDDILAGNVKRKVQEFIQTYFKNHHGSIVLGTIESALQEEKWKVNVIARTDPNIIFTEKERLQIQDGLQKLVGKPVSFAISLVPLLSLRDEKDEGIDKLKEDLSNFILDKTQEVEISSITINETSSKTYHIIVRIEVPINVDPPDLNNLKQYLSEKYKSNFEVEIITSEVIKETL